MPGTILEQAAEVARGLAHKYKNILEGVVEPMFGPYYKSETRKAMEHSFELGRDEGIEKMAARLKALGVERDQIISSLMEDYEMDLDSAMGYVDRL